MARVPSRPASRIRLEHARERLCREHAHGRRCRFRALARADPPCCRGFGSRLVTDPTRGVLPCQDGEATSNPSAVAAIATPLLYVTTAIGILAQGASGREMDSVQASQGAGAEKPGIVEQFVVQRHEVDSIQELSGSRQCPAALRADGANHFGAGEAAGRPLAVLLRYRIRAADSGSRTTSFTSADESR